MDSNERERRRQRRYREAMRNRGIAAVVLVILIVGALTFFPALMLGPLVEHFLMLAGRTF